MELRLFQIDAFADRPFAGNPAAVCPLERWLPDEVLQAIAGENNLSETAYFVPTASGYHIRWFTPLREVRLCGHATLASAYVLFTILGHGEGTLDFDSHSGRLTVRREGERLEMDFPIQVPSPCATPEPIMAAFQATPVQCLRAEDYIVVFSDEGLVRSCAPAMDPLRRLDLRGVAVTAPSTEYDFVTRFFAPKYGIDEDPVTGSAFTQLIPYWAEVLRKQGLTAKQVSKRGGEVWCGISGQRVSIAGRAVKYLEGRIWV